MVLACDIGNSSIDIGVFGKEGEPAFVSKISSEVVRTTDEYAVMLSGIMSLHGVSASDIDGCIISSVVPRLTTAVEAAVRQLFAVEPIEVGPGIKTGLDIKIDSQAQLGSDIVANAAAALGEFAPPLVIVDVGTATTFTVIDENRVLQGVIIAPGLSMSMNALSRGASELPDSSISLPRRMVGKNTKESMNSGVLYGHAFMIDGFISSLCGDGRPVLLTGGLAPQVKPLLKSRTVSRPHLTLKGLYALYLKNSRGA